MALLRWSCSPYSPAGEFSFWRVHERLQESGSSGWSFLAGAVYPQRRARIFPGGEAPPAAQAGGYLPEESLSTVHVRSCFTHPKMLLSISSIFWASFWASTL